MTDLPATDDAPDAANTSRATPTPDHGFILGTVESQQVDDSLAPQIDERDRPLYDLIVARLSSALDAPTDERVDRLVAELDLVGTGKLPTAALLSLAHNREDALAWLAPVAERLYGDTEAVGKDTNRLLTAYHARYKVTDEQPTEGLPSTPTTFAGVEISEWASLEHEERLIHLVEFAREHLENALRPESRVFLDRTHATRLYSVIRSASDDDYHGTLSADQLDRLADVAIAIGNLDHPVVDQFWDPVLLPVDVASELRSQIGNIALFSVLNAHQEPHDAEDPTVTSAVRALAYSKPPTVTSGWLRTETLTTKMHGRYDDGLRVVAGIITVCTDHREFKFSDLFDEHEAAFANDGLLQNASVEIADHFVDQLLVGVCGAQFVKTACETYLARKWNKRSRPTSARAKSLLLTLKNIQAAPDQAVAATASDGTDNQRIEVRLSEINYMIRSAVRGDQTQPEHNLMTKAGQQHFAELFTPRNQQIVDRLLAAQGQLTGETEAEVDVSTTIAALTGSPYPRATIRARSLPQAPLTRRAEDGLASMNPVFAQLAAQRIKEIEGGSAESDHH